MRRHSWTGWGPSQHLVDQSTHYTPFAGMRGHHRVAGWDWDEPLNGYVTHSRKKFACDCGEDVDVPEYKNCKCGKIWYTVAIGSGPDTRTAAPELFLAREIPVRKDVILASNHQALTPPPEPGGDYRTNLAPPGGDDVESLLRAIMESGDESRDEQGNCTICGAPDGGKHARECPYRFGPRGHFAGFQDDFARDIVDHVPDNPDQARYVNYLNRWENMRRNEQHQYRPGPEVSGYQDYWPSGELPARAASQIYAAEDASTDYMLNEFDDWLYGQGDSLANIKRDPSALEAKLREYLDGATDPRVYEIMDRIGGRRSTAGIAEYLFGDVDNPDAARLGPGGRRNKPRYRGTPKYSPEYLDQLEDQYDGAYSPAATPRAAALLQAAEWFNPVVPWSGKTPGGPAGSGTEGLKQKTRYKGVSTPDLRMLRRQMLTAPNPGIDMNELLRELSFREVMGALHDLSAPGGTPGDAGTTTKRTDPQMNNPADWHRRDQAGRWQRGDGHPTKAAS